MRNRKSGFRANTKYGAKRVLVCGAYLCNSLFMLPSALAQDSNSPGAPPLAPSIQTTVQDDKPGISSAQGAAGNAAQGASAAKGAVSVKEQLSSFEDRFFAHTFSDESDSRRLDRIERVVYGSRRSGDVQQRLNRLMMDVPVISTSTNPAMPPAASTNQNSNDDDDQDPATPEQAYNDYPTVTALEEEILGKTYEQLSVQQRLSQLEVKAFGQASSSDDLAARVDRLRQYVASKNGPSENYLQSNAPNFASSLQPGSLESQVAEMEQEVYGKTYGRDTLMSRLNRLDNTVFAGQPPQTFTPLNIRVNKLWSALEPKFSSPQTAYKYQPAPQQDNKDDKKKDGHPIWRKIGHFVEGVGMVAGEAAGAAAAGSMMGYGYGGYGWGYPGYFGGLGYYGGGWGYPHYMW